MTPNSQEGLVRQVRIAAKPETIFPYFVDAEKMLLWMGIEADLDPRPGGNYRVNITGKDVAVGRYVEIVPHSRVVFTWGWEGAGNPVPPGKQHRGGDLYSGWGRHGSLAAPLRLPFSGSSGCAQRGVGALPGSPGNTGWRRRSWRRIPGPVKTGNSMQKCIDHVTSCVSVKQ